jgi:hypothetical protein
MCFNAFKQHEFGWYSSQEEYVNGSNVWTGELIAFVDATKDRAKPVIINVGQTHMQLNSKKSFNSTLVTRLPLIMETWWLSFVQSILVATLIQPDSASTRATSLRAVMFLRRRRLPRRLPPARVASALII